MNQQQRCLTVLSVAAACLAVVCMQAAPAAAQSKHAGSIGDIAHAGPVDAPLGKESGGDAYDYGALGSGLFFKRLHVSERSLTS
jgi:hypothetical protein